MIQHMKNNPTKWGYKVWVITDISGYTFDFNIYTGKSSTNSSEQGLSFDVVMELVAPFQFQGYKLLQITSIRALVCLMCSLKWEFVQQELFALIVLEYLIVLQELMKTKTARGTGYYVHESSTTYICWRDVRVVTMITTAYPGHYEHYVT